MKRLIAVIILAGSLCGCQQTVNAPTPPLAPGYTNDFDQHAGQALAGLHAFVSQAGADYPKLTPAQQAAEKTILNNMIVATNTADALYVAYHHGTATQAQVQTAINNAQTAQATYTQAGGIK